METGNTKLCETESGYSFEPVQKDNRSRYLKEETKCFQETNLNSGFYQQYLKENQIERYELEACGHEIVIPKGKHSLHLPFFRPIQHSFVHCMQSAHVETVADRKL